MTKANNITPLGFNVLVEIVEYEEKTQGGIIIPGNNEKEIRSELVKIIKSGASAFTDCFGNQESPSQEQPYALIQKNAGQPFMIGNSRCRLVQSDHILSTMDEQAAIAYCYDNFNFTFNPNKE